jgi:hypothetical protein
MNVLNKILQRAVKRPEKQFYFSLLSTKNISDCVYPCPCGWRGDVHKQCACAEATVTKYQKRISGLLLDRIDIHIEVPRVEETFNNRDLPIANHLISSATWTCAPGRYGSIANYRQRVRA